MTRDRARKRAARALRHNVGGSYSAAHWALTDPKQARAADIHRRLANALRAFGWPVETDILPELGEYRCYSGPATLAIETEQQEWHPLSANLILSAHAPLMHEAPDELWAYADADQPIANLVSWANQAIAQGRRQALSATPGNHTECDICGDHYPQTHLLGVSDSAEDQQGGFFSFCPSCMFDTDIGKRWRPEILSHHLDELLYDQFAAPAGWNAIIALFACAAAPDWRRDLQALWHGNGILPLPATHWSTPEQLWLWLPEASTRPAALRHLGCGASLGAVMNAIDQAFPAARQQATHRLNREWAENAQEWDGPPDIDPITFLNHIWPASIAYLISFHTQSQERAEHRSPWHLWHSLELDLGRFDTMGRSDDDLSLEATLRHSIDVLASLLKIDVS
ncbi:hypothetical protein [Crossiella sp. CA198]|uniref:hypothetical protein n=1 Tax=Crossiella sp. CA198 TaxID=3455607 RepID=UPI003F8D04C3